MRNGFLEALIRADQAETALGCFFITHQDFAGTSDLQEYDALWAQQRTAAEQRHQAYLAWIRSHREPD